MLVPGANAGDIANNSFCAQLSNPITVNREVCCTAASAEISISGADQSIDVCVNDETLELVQFELLERGSGENYAWIVTDTDGTILELFEDAPALDFFGGTEGTCLVWYLNYDGELARVPQIGDSAGDLVADSFCAELSNPVTITRTCCCPYTCLLYTSPSPRDATLSRMPSSA